MSGWSARLGPTLALTVLLSDPAIAETTAQTAEQWGLLGAWSVDCSLPADHAKGAVLVYESKGDKLISRRDFGDTHDDAEVLSADIAGDDVLSLRIYFPSVKQTREFGMKHVNDDSIRTVFSRDDKGRYSIKDGKVVQTGKPTPVQHRCVQSPS